MWNNFILYTFTMYVVCYMFTTYVICYTFTMYIIFYTFTMDVIFYTFTMYIICYTFTMYIISYILLYSRFLFGMISLRIDKAFYGEWTLVPLNFFTFNIPKKISHIYGEY